MDYVEKARALRADPAVHYNCCQAVLVTFADRLRADFHVQWLNNGAALASPVIL